MESGDRPAGIPERPSTSCSRSHETLNLMLSSWAESADRGDQNQEASLSFGMKT